MTWVCKKDCKKRSPTCHAKCPAYLDFLEKNDQIKRRRKEAKDITNAIYDIGHMPKPRKRKGGS